MITFAIASLSATIVFPILSPLFLNPKDSILAEALPESLRAILLGLFLASFPLAQFLFSPLIGDYSDRKGRKKAYLFTLILEVIGYFFSAWAIEYRILWLLFVARFVTGLAAGNMSVCLATLVDLSTDNRTKVRYFSLGSALIGVMFVLGPFIGGKLSDPNILPIFNYAFPMWVGTGFAAINFFVLWILFHETKTERSDDPFDLMKALHNVQLAFRTRQIKDLYIIYFFFLFSWNMLYQFIPAVMVELFKATSSTIGDFCAIMGVIWIIGTLLVIWLLHTSIRMKYVMIVSLFCLSVCAILVSGAELFYHFAIIVAMGVFFAGGVWPLFTGAISKAADQNTQGKILGLSQSIQSLSMVLAPFLGGFFLQADTGVPFAISAVSALFAAAYLTKTKSAYFQM